jgi:GGDEF domain-containing protein
VAVFPDDGHSVDDLIHAADSAMYRHKAARRATGPFLKVS